LFSLFPNIAILIAAYNEEAVIQNTIDALLEAGVIPQDIYVVDDKSTDNTAAIVRQNDVNLLALKRNVGKAAALRTAISKAKFEQRYKFVISMDADTIVHPKFIQAFEDASRNDDTTALFVGQVKSSKGNYISALRSVEYAIGHDIHKAGQSNIGAIFVAPGCVSMYRASWLPILRFEGDTLAEDMDLTMQIQRAKGRIVYVPKAVVYTQDPRTIKDYIKQITRWQRGGWQVFKKHKVLSMNKKQAVDWLIIFQTVDAFIFNRATWLIGSAILLPWHLIWLSLAVDIALSFVISCYVAIKNRRLDVVYKFPMYFWIGYINMYTYFKTFYEVMIVKREVLVWNKVQRY
jgi:biofilm PGA synthesis N-glycosyltransferase PgaC